MPQRKAVVIGINDYEGTINDLPSCVADATTFRNLLESRFGFAAQDVHLLTDAQATRAAVGQELDWLMGGAALDDRLVLFYSGHGYQQAQNGVREEYLVLRDGLFHDDDLSRRTQGLPPGVLTVVLDCCFGGGMEKVMQLLAADAPAGLGFDWGGLGGVAAVAAAAPPAVATAGSVKVWTPPDVKQLRADVLAARAATRVKPFGRGVRPARRGARKGLVLMAADDEAGQVPMKGLLVSACQENETAAASTPATRGMSAFTYALTCALGSAPGAVATKELVARATLQLHMIGVGQTPQIKEPAAPPAASSLSFIDLAPVQKQQDESPGGDSASPILELIRLVFGKELSMSGIDTSLLLPLLLLSQKQQQAGASKGTAEDILGVLRVVLPLIKGRQAESADKGLLGDVLPWILQAAMSKAAPAPQDKNWVEDAFHVIGALAPIILKAQPQPQPTNKRLFDFWPTPTLPPFMSVSGDGADKSWITDAVSILATLAPILAKGQQSQGSSRAEKGWVADILPLIQLAVG